jgi:putative sigma-54 modulation protein
MRVDIRLTGKNFTVTSGVQDHLREKISRFEKYAPHLVSCHVILKKEKYLFEAEMTLAAKNFRAYGEGVSKDNILTAIDQAYERVDKQLKKFRSRVKDHHKRGIEQTKGFRKREAREEGSRPVLAESPRPAIIRAETFAVKPMSTEEASLQLELSNKPFLVFLNSLTQKVNVIYHREDGNHGLIEPAF